jgi:phosphocarrier protein HPr
VAKLAQEMLIANQRGLHARASAKFVKLVQQFAAAVTVTKGDDSVSGQSIMGLMTLGAGLGSTILVEADGADAREALAALNELINEKFGEE